MSLLTITVYDDFAAALDRVIATCGYQNRSEAIAGLTAVRSPNSCTP
jgi:metal-responsive CopG/Arc/MetJ family transcriptional regulator